MSIVTDCRPEVVDGLLALVGIGLFQDHDDDAVAVLDAVRVWRPDAIEVRVYEAWLALKRGDCAEGARIFSELSEKGAGEKTQLCRALLAVCRAALGDPSWESLAQSVIDDGSDIYAVTLMRSMRGERIDLPDIPPNVGGMPVISQAVEKSPSPRTMYLQA